MLLEVNRRFTSDNLLLRNKTRKESSAIATTQKNTDFPEQNKLAALRQHFVLFGKSVFFLYASPRLPIVVSVWVIILDGFYTNAEG